MIRTAISDSATLRNRRSQAIAPLSRKAARRGGGWWKKETEHFDEAFLSYLRAEVRRKPTSVGLLNRKGEETFAAARCVDVRFSTDGTSIASPELALTPEYYRSACFPAWFKFTEIRDLTLGEFKRDFGDIPSLDPTLYDVSIHDDGSVEMQPSPAWTMEAVPTVGNTILHLSDLHFGDDYGFPLERRQGHDVDRFVLLDIIAKRVVKELGLRVGVVVVSGDLITRGDANGYTMARAFLEELLQCLGLEKKHCVIVPGNHDLWTEGLPHPTRTYGHELPYKQFIAGFFENPIPQGLERVRRYRIQGNEDLVFVELNSARIRSDVLREYGYVAKHRYEALLKWIRDVLRQNQPPRLPRVCLRVFITMCYPFGPCKFPIKEAIESLSGRWRAN